MSSSEKLFPLLSPRLPASGDGGGGLRMGTGQHTSDNLAEVRKLLRHLLSKFDRKNTGLIACRSFLLQLKSMNIQFTVQQRHNLIQWYAKDPMAGSNCQVYYIQALDGLTTKTHEGLNATSGKVVRNKTQADWVFNPPQQVGRLVPPIHQDKQGPSLFTDRSHHTKQTFNQLMQEGGTNVPQHKRNSSTHNEAAPLIAANSTLRKQAQGGHRPTLWTQNEGDVFPELLNAEITSRDINELLAIFHTCDSNDTGLCDKEAFLKVAFSKVSTKWTPELLGKVTSFAHDERSNKLLIGKFLKIQDALNELRMAANAGTTYETGSTHSLHLGAQGGSRGQSPLASFQRTQSMTLQKTRDLLQLDSLCHRVLARMQERFKLFPNAYYIFDNNKDGRMSLGEFAKGMQVLGVRMNIRDIVRVFNHLDNDSSGYLDFKEFCGLLAQDVNSKKVLDGGIQYDMFGSDLGVKSNRSGPLSMREMASMQYLGSTRVLPFYEYKKQSEQAQLSDYSRSISDWSQLQLSSTRSKQML